MKHHLLLFVLLTQTFVLLAQTSGKVIKVADGDTFTIVDAYGQTHKIRLYGIDCPELKQPYGREAKNYTSNWVLGQTVTIQKLSKDRNGRVVAKVLVNGSNLNELLLKNGYAWHFTRYDQSALYASLQQQAKNAKIGLWSNPYAMAPWDWRKRK